LSAAERMCGRLRQSESGMRSRDFIFLAVDVQADFMLPGGKLYVPRAEKLLPNIRKLTDAARRDQVFLVSHGDFHSANDPEFKQFPPHCLKGTRGAEFVPEALAENFVRVENDVNARLPEDLYKYQQIILDTFIFPITSSVVPRLRASGTVTVPRLMQCLTSERSLRARPAFSRAAARASGVRMGSAGISCISLAGAGAPDGHPRFLAVGLCAAQKGGRPAVTRPLLASLNSVSSADQNSSFCVPS